MGKSQGFFARSDVVFGRLNDVRLKAAEQALEAGRLDEALAAATADDLADRRRAAQLLSRLFGPLMTRAQEHLLGARFREALADLDKAARCGVGAEKVAEWRGRAMAAMADHQRKEKAERAALEAAEDRLADGSLTLAAENLDRVSEGAKDRARLEGEIASAAERAQRLAEEARTAMKAEQYAVAVERLAAARRNHAASPAVLEVGDAVARRLVERAREALTAGRLDVAAHELQLARRVDAARPDVAEAGRALAWVHDAAEHIVDGRYDEAGILLGKFTQLAGAAAWAKKAREHLEGIRGHLTELAQGPLGLGAEGKEKGTKGQRDKGTKGDLGPCNTGGTADETLSRPAVAVARQARGKTPPVVDAKGLPRRMVMRIDGVGSFLLLRSDRIVIGRAGGAADLPIQADLSERHAEILRNGEDYFLIGHAGVALAEQQVQQALLSHGDRIRLGRRVRMTFERPSRKSTAATLVLGDGVRSVTDVKRVILWSGPILLGPTTDCHVPIHGLLSGLVLVERGGQIQLRPVGGGAVGEVLPVRIGQVVEAGPLRFSLQEA